MAGTFSRTQQQTLLLVIGVLAFFRFVAMPWYHTQNEQIENLRLVTQQLERAERLMALEGSIEEDTGAILDIIQKKEQLFLPHLSNSEFRLSAQQRLQSIIREHSVQISLFEWLGNRVLVDNYLIGHQGRIEIDGPAEELLSVHLAMRDQVSGLHLDDMVLQSQRGGRLRMTLVFEMRGIVTHDRGPQ